MYLAIPILLFVASPARAQDDPADRARALLVEARQEVEAIDGLLDDADSRAVRKELHHKAEHLHQVLDQLADLTAPARLSVRSDGGGAVVSSGAGGVTIDAGGATGGVSIEAGSGGVNIRVGAPGEQGSVPPAARAPCSAGDLQRVLAAIGAEDFSDGKLSALRSAAADTWFSSDQARQLIDAFDFGSDQVEAGAILYPRVVDPENWFVVYQALDFDADKQALRQRVGR